MRFTALALSLWLIVSTTSPIAATLRLRIHGHAVDRVGAGGRRRLRGRPRDRSDADRRAPADGRRSSRAAGQGRLPRKRAHCDRHPRQDADGAGAHDRASRRGPCVDRAGGRRRWRRLQQEMDLHRRRPAPPRWRPWSCSRAGIRRRRWATSGPRRAPDCRPAPTFCSTHRPPTKTTIPSRSPGISAMAPQAPGPDTSHIYATAGTFTAKVTASDGKASASSQATVTIRSLAGTWRSNPVSYTLGGAPQGTMQWVFTVTQASAVLTGTLQASGAVPQLASPGTINGLVATSSPAVTLQGSVPGVAAADVRAQSEHGRHDADGTVGRFRQHDADYVHAAVASSVFRRPARTA